MSALWAHGSTYASPNDWDVEESALGRAAREYLTLLMEESLEKDEPPLPDNPALQEHLKGQITALTWWLRRAVQDYWAYSEDARLFP